MDSIPNELLALKTHFDQWRANRKYRSEPMPDELRRSALEMADRYPSSLLLQVLKVQVWHLRRGASKRSGSAKKAPKLANRAFFKLPPCPQTATADSSSTSTSTDCRLQLERPDGSRLTLTAPSLDISAFNALCADFLRGSGK
jgi:nitroreductase